MAECSNCRAVMQEIQEVQGFRPRRLDHTPTIQPSVWGAAWSANGVWSLFSLPPPPPPSLSRLSLSPHPNPNAINSACQVRKGLPDEEEDQGSEPDEDDTGIDLKVLNNTQSLVRQGSCAPQS